MKKKYLITAGLILALGISVSGITLVESKEDISISQAVRILPISIYDRKNLLKISIEDVGKFHGRACYCVVASFRAVQLAIVQIWKDKIPERRDFKIISAFPTRGSQDVFEFITRVKSRGDFTLALPPGTDRGNFNFNNYAFIFIRKSTGERIKIWVKNEILSEYFSKLKKVESVKLPIAEKIKILKLAEQKLKDTFMNLPLNKLFEFKKK